MLLRDFANEDPPSAKLDGLHRSFEEGSYSAPIDAFRTSIAEIVAFGVPQQLNSNIFLGRLLALGIVSACEAYFRGVLSSTIELCPICQSHSSDRSVQLGGILWHGTTGYSRSAFEHASFASSKELKKVCRDYLNFELKDATFRSLLSEYEKVCHLRHGIVHNGGLLPGRNAVQLEVKSSGGPKRIVIFYEQLQEIAAVVSNLVVTFNRELFAELCHRWAVDWRRRADWDPSIEEKRFANIWSTFHSKEELKTRKGRSKITRSKCMEIVRNEYNL